jgi:hypothetical protein
VTSYYKKLMIIIITEDSFKISKKTLSHILPRSIRKKTEVSITTHEKKTPREQARSIFLKTISADRVKKLGIVWEIYIFKL